MPDRKPAVPQERHRRMAAKWLRLSAGRMDRENAHAQLIATVERDAFARGVEAALAVVREKAQDWCGEDGGDMTHWDVLHYQVEPSIRALLPEPPRTGPELAAEHGFPPLAESGAARVPAVERGGK